MTKKTIEHLEGVAALDRRHHDTTDDTNRVVKKTVSKKLFIYSLILSVIIGDMIGGAWVSFVGPNVPLVWDGLGEKSYMELMKAHEEDVKTHKADVALHIIDVRLHAEDVRLHDEDVRLHAEDVRLHAEDVARHNLDIDNREELIGKLAVSEKQNKWLWHSHHVFKAVLYDDESFLLKGGAWEFAKKHWPQLELKFVAESFHRSALAESETAHNNREAHQQNKLLFMSSMLWDNVDELARVDLSDLPPGWVSDYPKLMERLKRINATNVIQHLDSKQIGAEAAVNDHPLGGH